MIQSDRDSDVDDLAELDQPPLSDTERILHRLLDVINTARPVPLSTSAMINREEISLLIEQALNVFPEEVRQSRWLLKEREDFLAKVRQEGEEILAQARSKSERLVQRSELVKAAEARAAKITEAAESDARRMRLEVEDYCDQKLASFEIVLEKTVRLVGQGRERLQLRSRGQGPDAPTLTEEEAADMASGGRDVFDQDQA